MIQRFLENYTIISPFRNEKKYFEKPIQSISNQAISLIEYFLANDDSTEKYFEFIDKDVLQHKRLRIYNKSKDDHCSGVPTIKDFNMGLQKIEIISWNFILKIERNISFGNNYFEQQLIGYNNLKLV